MILIIILFLSVSSCSTYEKKDQKLDQDLYLNNDFSDQELFKIASDHISSDNFDLALIELDKIEVLYPSSKYASKSVLLTAYVNFLKKDYEKTRVLAENYKRYYPGSDDIVYANYLEAMTYYVLMKKSNYSSKNSEMALEKFTFILKAYPNSKYELDIITKIQIINDNLANSKLETAKFYLDKNNYNAALIYLLDIFNNHNTSTTITETLFILSKIYYEIDEIEISKRYASILAHNFPDSSWYKKAYNQLNNLEEIKDDVRWFEKYNPLNIFIKDEKNLSTNTDIQKLK